MVLPPRETEDLDVDGDCGGGDYDSPLGESAGAGGGSGAYVSDKVIAVTAGETLTFFNLQK